MWIDKSGTSQVAAGNKNVLTAIFGRYKSRVKSTISQLEIGKFPKI